MNIKITARHMELSDKLKDYADKKFSRIEKYFNQMIDTHLILRINKLDHTAEIIVNGDGVQFYGTETSGDMYSSIDLLVDKMEKQIVRYKEKHSSHKVTPPGKMSTFEMTNDAGINIQMNQVSQKPVDAIGAYLEMKLDKRDFIIFKLGVNEVKKDSTDYLNRNYALIYRDGDKHRMVEIPFDMIREYSFDVEKFLTYDLIVHDASPSKPKIDIKKSNGGSLKQMTIADAVKEIQTGNSPYVPFFNAETLFFNVIYKSGNNIEVMVPAF